MLGGGGYTMRNVSRCWAFETGLAAGVELGHGMLPVPHLFCLALKLFQRYPSTSIMSILDLTTSWMFGHRTWRT